MIPPILRMDEGVWYNNSKRNADDESEDSDMSDLNIVCLDLEGVLVPEIWIAFSEASGIPVLRRTTRDSRITTS